MPIKQNFLKKHKQISLFDRKNRMKKFSSKMCKKMGKKEVAEVWFLDYFWNIDNNLNFLLHRNNQYPPKKSIWMLNYFKRLMSERML